MARLAMILGGVVLLALAGCVEDEPEQEDDGGRPFPGINRDNYRVFPKNPKVVEAPPVPSPDDGCLADRPADPSPAMTVASTKDLPSSCDANLVAQEYRRLLVEGCPRATDFSLRIGGSITLDAGASAGGGCFSPRGRLAAEGTSGNVTGKIEVGAGR